MPAGFNNALIAVIQGSGRLADVSPVSQPVVRPAPAERVQVCPLGLSTSDSEDDKDRLESLEVTFQSCAQSVTLIKADRNPISCAHTCLKQLKTTELDLIKCIYVEPLPFAAVGDLQHTHEYMCDFNNTEITSVKLTELTNK